MLECAALKPWGFSDSGFDMFTLFHEFTVMLAYLRLQWLECSLRKIKMSKIGKSFNNVG